MVLQFQRVTDSWLIRRNITYKEQLIIPLYQATVIRHVVYTDIYTLDRIQRRAITIIPELRDLSYEERMKECCLTNQETRRLRGGQI